MSRGVEGRLGGELELPAHACAGHFPGRPVVPGVLQLILVCDFLRAATGDAAAVASIPRVRFRRPTVPGDVLRVEAEAVGAGWRFKLMAGDAVACDGSLVREALPALEPGQIEPPVSLEASPAAIGCLPHRPPMLLVDGVLELSDTGGVCCGAVGAEAPLVRDHRVPGLAAVEVAAQALGYLEAAAHPERGSPRVGYLVGVSEVRLGVASFPVGVPLVAEVTRTAWVPPMARAEARVCCGTSQIVTCSLTTWMAPEARPHAAETEPLVRR